MMEIQGKYGTAKVFTDVIDQPSISQIYNLLNQPFVDGCKVRMMPDVHAGIGCVIGTTMEIRDKAVPNLVGVDIGCGMEVAVLKEKHIELQKLDKVVHERIPSGMEKRSSVHRYLSEVPVENLRCAKRLNMDAVRVSFGSLGSGNHFAECNTDEDGNLYIVIHSGSRMLGVSVAAYYQKEAYKQRQGLDRPAVEARCRKTIDEYKAAHRDKELEGALVEARKGYPSDVPEIFAYCEGYLLDDYLHDMAIVQQYALWSRKAMMDEIVKGMGIHVVDAFTTIHNYIDLDAMVLRKGAVSALDGERLIIPINMRDGSLICTGKGNPDWNFSAPHGAGRLMSRADAKASLTLTEYKKQMQGIYSTSVNRSTIDEAPMAYKSMDDIVSNVGDSVTVEKIIKPIYNFKAGTED